VTIAWPETAFAAEGLKGAELGLLWAVPFVGILLSIALFPLLAPHFWEHHQGKIAALWGLLVAAPMAAIFGGTPTAGALMHAFLLEYLPFILLLLVLFTTAGGILIQGNIHGSPTTNTALLAIGAVLASFIGTTGASMVMIRPMIRANDGRRHNVHVVVFFIFLVSNLGGSLTPLGDPPLFLGFLKGVDFFWTTKHLFGETLVASGIVLGVFFSTLISTSARASWRPSRIPRRIPPSRSAGSSISR
jgi:Na+/H+ antiporter NhaD/arsenite permease-like protein